MAEQNGLLDISTLDLSTLEDNIIDPDTLKEIFQCAGLNSSSASAAFENFRIDNNSVSGPAEMFEANMKLVIGIILVEKAGIFNNDSNFNVEEQVLNKIKISALESGDIDLAGNGFKLEMPEGFFEVLANQMNALNQNTIPSTSVTNEAKDKIPEAQPKSDPTQIKWSSQVDNFGDMKPHSQACLANVLTHEGARDALYEGTNDPADENSKAARVEFLNYLQDVLMPAMKRLEPANEQGIELKDFLDAKGFELYKAAVNEEVRSQAFREAVFQKSTNHYDGPTWSQRLISPFAGPSAAGKSVSQPELIKKIAEQMPKSNRNEGNDVVSVDGGVEREMSQIRGMMLQVALAAGYNGITDLDKKENKADLTLKKIVEKTVLATPGLNMVIPKTYTREALNLISGSVGKDEFKKYDMVDDGNAVLAFGIVEAEHGNVVKNGTSRARNATEFTEADIAMNRKPPCESKDYHDHYKEGTYLSTAAKDNYLALGQADNKPRICVTVTSDFTFIKPDPKSPGGWALAEKDEEWNKDMVGMLKRDFERYQDYSQQNQQLISYKISTLKTTAENLKIFMNELTVELREMDVNSPEAIAKQNTLEKVKIQSEEVIAKLSDAMEEASSAKNTDVKGWLKENGWSPPMARVEIKESKLKENEAQAYANQLKSYVSSLYAQLKSEDFEGKEIGQNPGIIGLKTVYAQIVNKVKDDILLETSAEKRQEMVSFYIKVLQSSLKQDDHFSAQAIAATLEDINSKLGILSAEQVKYLASDEIQSIAAPGDKQKIYMSKMLNGEYKPGVIPVLAPFQNKMVLEFASFSEFEAKVNYAKQALDGIEKKGLEDPATIAIIKDKLKMQNYAKLTKEQLNEKLNKLASADIVAAKKIRDDSVSGSIDFLKQVASDAGQLEKIDFSALSTELEAPKVSALDTQDVYSLLRVNDASDIDLLIKNKEIQKNTFIFIPSSDGAEINIKFYNDNGVLINIEKTIPLQIDSGLPASVIKSHNEDINKFKNALDGLVVNEAVKVRDKIETLPLLIKASQVSVIKLKTPEEKIVNTIQKRNVKKQKELVSLYSKTQEVPTRKKSVGLDKVYDSVAKLNFRKKSLSVNHQTVQPQLLQPKTVKFSAAANNVATPKRESIKKRNKKIMKVGKISAGVASLTAAMVLTGGLAAGVALVAVAYQRRKTANAIRKAARTDVNANLNDESAKENNVNTERPVLQNPEQGIGAKDKKPIEPDVVSTINDEPKAKTSTEKSPYKPLADIAPSNQETIPKNDIALELNEQPVFVPKNSLPLQLLNEFVQVRNLDQLDKLMDLVNHESNRGHENTVWKFQDSELKAAEALLYKAITVARSEKSEKNVLLESKIQVLLSDVQKKQLTVASSLDANLKIDHVGNRTMVLFTQALQSLNKTNNPLRFANYDSNTNSARSTSQNASHSPYIPESTNPLLFTSFSNKPRLRPSNSHAAPLSNESTRNSTKLR